MPLTFGVGHGAPDPPVLVDSATNRKEQREAQALGQLERARLPAPSSTDAGNPNGAPSAPKGFHFGARLRLQHAATGLHLHSHLSYYPGTADQLVTCFAGHSENDFWVVQPATDSAARSGPVPHGALVRLRHAATGLHLCSGTHESYVAKRELSAFASRPPGAAAAGSADQAPQLDLWRPLFERGSEWVRLQHEASSSAGQPGGAPLLHSRSLRYPAWGHQQQEVTVSDAPDAAPVGASVAAAPAAGSSHPPSALWRVHPSDSVQSRLLARGGSQMRLGLSLPGDNNGSGRLPLGLLPAAGAADGDVCPPAAQPATAPVLAKAPYYLPLAKAALPSFSLGAPPLASLGADGRPLAAHPVALQVEGAPARGPARGFEGVYVLVVGLPVNGRPAWRHVTRPSCWLAHNGRDAWLGQLETELGEDEGFLELSGTSASPEGGGWRAVGDTNAWADVDGLRCVSVGGSFEEAEVAARCMQRWEREEKVVLEEVAEAVRADRKRGHPMRCVYVADDHALTCECMRPEWRRGV